jgi:hypothetical protein
VVLSVAALFDANEFVGWVSEDGNGATGILIRIDERRAIDAIAALPFDGKRGRGFHDLDRFRFAIAGEPCGEEISAVEQPCIAGFGREQDQLTNRDNASVVGERPENVGMATWEVRSPGRWSTGGTRMRWVLRLIATGDDARCLSTDLAEICRPEGLGDVANLGLTLPEAKQLLASVQRAVVTSQVDSHGQLRPCCRSCNGRCHLKDWREHCIATLFDEVTVRLPRFLCIACNRTELGVCWPSRCRSTPELDLLQAHLSALMSYRVAADVLQHLLPIDAGRSPETLRHHTLRIGAQLGAATADQPTAASAAAITVSVDSTFIRSRAEGERHLEVRVGNVETASGGRQVFGAVTKADTDISALIRQGLRAVGRADDTEVTAFTDGCPGLRSILVDAGVTTPPILDWFHIAMWIQHATQIASGLPTDDAGKMQAKIVIVEEVERLRWRIWNGKAKNAKRSINRVRKVMHAYKGERGHNMRTAPSHRLWHALLDVDGYLRGQSSWLVNYAKRHRAGLRVGTSITEGTANFLVNRRMNKSQQMRWSRRDADLLLQVRCAVYNGTLGSGLGHRFQPHANQNERSANAA